MRAVALCVLLSAGCAAKRAEPARKITDTAGRTVALPAHVGRIVSLAPSTTEIVCALGACASLVGVDKYSNFPAAIDKVDRVGNNTDPSIERIVGLKPDLVLAATTANSEATVRTLERLHIPVFTCRETTLDDVWADIRGIGDAIGRTGEAAALVDGLRGRLRQLPSGRKPTKALVVVWPEPLVVAGGGSLVSEVITLAGGENVAADSPQGFPSYSVERMLVRAPEVIIVGTHADGAPPLGAIERLPLPAVRDHRVHLVDGDLLFRPGPRIVDAAEILARLFHPAVDGGVR